ATSPSSERPWPESGRISPAMIRSSVVLPHPLGPRMTMVWPLGILRLRGSMRNVDSAPPRRADSVSVLPTSMRSILAMRARLFELQVLERRRVRETGDAAVAGVGHARPPPPDERLLEERDGSGNDSTP